MVLAADKMLPVKGRRSNAKESGFRSFGLELTGPRVARSTVAVLDYYPKSRRLILSDLLVPGAESEDQDEALCDYFEHQLADRKSVCQRQVATNAPLGFPPLLALKMGAPKSAYLEECQWIESTWQKLKPRPRVFLDYVHRPVEIYLRHLCPERFAFADAMGSNQVLLAARLMKLRERIKLKLFECSPRASFHRICRNLRARSFILSHYSSLTDGLEARKDFMHLLQRRIPELFVFEESLEQLILHIHAFHAFIMALTLHFEHRGFCEKAPPQFPGRSQWILIPRQQIDWDKLL